jgi:hypothetical protein
MEFGFVSRILTRFLHSSTAGKILAVCDSAFIQLVARSVKECSPLKIFLNVGFVEELAGTYGLLCVGFSGLIGHNKCWKCRNLLIAREYLK